MTSERVLEIFEDITRIPRESGHEELIIAYLQNFAAAHSLECRTDEAGNVVIVKPAAAGMEEIPALVLQSHSDMVCEKNSDVEHDFAKDPIRYEFRDGWMIAPDTTLGADCGIGIAAQLAVLESAEPAGKIECLFTVSEETGLDGAKALKPGFITGKTLINLDSEDEGELFVGCAGGLDTTAVFDCSLDSVPEDFSAVSFRIFNGIGGHSGDDIDKGRANAVQLLARFLHGILGMDIRIAEIDGGNKRNAIAREACCTVVLPKGNLEAVKAEFRTFASEAKAEYAVAEPALSFECKDAAAKPEKAIDADCTARVVSALFAAPHGVLAMSMDIKGLVETSTNLASVKMTGDGGIRVGTSQRSSITSARRMAGEKVRAAFELAGAEVTHESEYPGWQPNMKSAILDESVKAYRSLFGTEPVVRAIHAGLECGLFLDIYPDLDMISFGPTLRGVHAPGERLELASLDRFVRLLDRIIADFR
ncbi:MAG: aminoacyl-histidine dipeptidase [Bacteroidales bacterium]|nr:aminoacyl-histidine dipeptidase [Bacteroidales bacterium]